jgi:hypothetical protein
MKAQSIRITTTATSKRFVPFLQRLTPPQLAQFKRRMARLQRRFERRINAQRDAEVGLCGRIVTALDQRAVWIGCRRWRLGFWYRLHESSRRWPLLSKIARTTHGWNWRVWRIAFTLKAHAARRSTIVGTCDACRHRDNNSSTD